MQTKQTVRMRALRAWPGTVPSLVFLGMPFNHAQEAARARDSFFVKSFFVGLLKKLFLWAWAARGPIVPMNLSYGYA